FVSFIIQFQFHKSLCDIAQPNVPLYQCDIDGNREAGARLAKMLSLGSSESWPHAMKLMTGSEKMSAQPLIEYFTSLFKYIDEQIRNETVGWNVDGKWNHALEWDTGIRYQSLTIILSFLCSGPICGHFFASVWIAQQ